jgi:uncharacterized protein (TIGR03000 family)
VLRIGSFALAVPALLLAAALAAAQPGPFPPRYVGPPNTYQYPSGRDFVSPANRTLSNYYAPPQSYYLHPASPGPYYVAPHYQYPPTAAMGPPPGGSPLDEPLVPRALRVPEAPPPSPAEIEVRVPAGAEIWFNGEKTRQTGAVRVFRSPPLELGQRYAYDIKARWAEGGKEVERTLHVPVTAGARQSVTFRE